MASTIKIKSNATAGKAPTALEQGELAVNVVDKQLYVGDAAKAPQALIPPQPPMGNWNIKGIGADHTLSNADIIPDVPIMYQAWNAAGTDVKITIPDLTTLTNWTRGQPLAFSPMNNLTITFDTTGSTVLLPPGKILQPRGLYSLIVLALSSVPAKQILCYGDLADKP